MNRGFWDKLRKPIFALAPMANVTDAAFRQLIAKYGKPDVFWTEFVSADGLCSDGKKKLLVDLEFSKKEHPIVAQIFGSNPEKFFQAAGLIKKLGFDGIDINMGCPDKAVEKQGGGAALMKSPGLAKELIAAVQEGSGLPVSVKTRIGYNKISYEDWLPNLLGMDLAAITVHLRTRKEMSKVAAHWELASGIVDLIHQQTTKASRPILLGNGDVTSLADAKQKIVASGLDGVMIGRGIFGNPWLFNKKTQLEKISTPKRISAMLEHSKLFEKKFKGIKYFEVMRKHFKAYVNGFDGAKELRIKLMDAENYKEVEKLVKEFIKKK